jgi:hypothetical protein
LAIAAKFLGCRSKKFEILAFDLTPLTLFLQRSKARPAIRRLGWDTRFGPMTAMSEMEHLSGCTVQLGRRRPVAFRDRTLGGIPASRRV